MKSSRPATKIPFADNTQDSDEPNHGSQNSSVLKVTRSGDSAKSEQSDMARLSTQSTENDDLTVKGSKEDTLN